MIKHIALIFIFMWSLVLGQSVYAVQTMMKNIRVWSKQDSTRVVFELSSKPQMDTLELENPERYVVDLKNTQCQLNIKPNLFQNSPILNFRHSIRQSKDCRSVFELNNKLPTNSFVLEP